MTTLNKLLKELDAELQRSRGDLVDDVKQGFGSEQPIEKTITSSKKYMSIPELHHFLDTVQKAKRWRNRKTAPGKEELRSVVLAVNRSGAFGEHADENEVLRFYRDLKYRHEVLSRAETLLKNQLSQAETRALSQAVNQPENRALSQAENRALSQAENQPENRALSQAENLVNAQREEQKCLENVRDNIDALATHLMDTRKDLDALQSDFGSFQAIEYLLEVLEEQLREDIVTADCLDPELNIILDSLDRQGILDKTKFQGLSVQNKIAGMIVDVKEFRKLIAMVESIKKSRMAFIKTARHPRTDDDHLSFDGLGPLGYINVHRQGIDNVLCALVRNLRTEGDPTVQNVDKKDLMNSLGSIFSPRMYKDAPQATQPLNTNPRRLLSYPKNRKSVV